MNFDYKFYLNLYPDVKILKKYNLSDENKAKMHWMLYGKNEGRIPNIDIMLKKYKHNLQESIDSLTKNIATKKFSYFNKNKIHILIRTTKNREEMLAKTLKSIEYQNYQNIKIFISYDHIDCLPYLQNIQQKSYLKDKLKYFKVEKISNNQCYFDLYCNELLDKVEEGFVMFLDDDNYLIDENVLKVINNEISKDRVLIWKFIRPDKYIYPQNMFNIRYGEVDTCSFCFYKDKNLLAKWKDFYGSDYYFFMDVYKHFDRKVKGLDFGLISVQNRFIVNHFKDYLPQNHSITYT